MSRGISRASSRPSGFMMSRFAPDRMRPGRTDSGLKYFRFRQKIASYAPVPSESFRIGLTFPGGSRTVPAIPEAPIGNKKSLRNRRLQVFPSISKYFHIFPSIFAARPPAFHGASGSVGIVHPPARPNQAGGDNPEISTSNCFCPQDRKDHTNVKSFNSRIYNRRKSYPSVLSRQSGRESDTHLGEGLVRQNHSGLDGDRRKPRHSFEVGRIHHDQYRRNHRLR